MTAQTKVTLSDFRQQQQAAWQQVHSGSVTLPDGRQLDFHWRSPSGKLITMLKTVVDEKTLNKWEKQGLDGQKRYTEALNNNIEVIGTFLANTLCTPEGELEYPEGYDEFYNSGFGDLNSLEIYMAIFQVISESMDVIKKKPASTKSPRKKR